jgi:hypothetical protein
VAAVAPHAKRATLRQSELCNLLLLPLRRLHRNDSGLPHCQGCMHCCCSTRTDVPHTTRPGAPAALWCCSTPYSPHARCPGAQGACAAGDTIHPKCALGDDLGTPVLSSTR